jgi:hypothetical protein
LITISPSASLDRPLAIDIHWDRQISANRKSTPSRARREQ